MSVVIYRGYGSGYLVVPNLEKGPIADCFLKMVLIITILALLSILICWIVFVPFIIRIDTEADHYDFYQPNTLHLSLYPGEKIYVRIKVFGFRLPAMARTRVKITHTTSKASGKNKFLANKTPQDWWFLVKGAIKSFRLKNLYLNIDLEDVVLNAQLVPLLLFLSRKPVQITTNFTRQYCLRLEAQWQLYKLLWALFKFILKG